MRKKLFVANWKMHKTAAEADAFFTVFEQFSIPPVVDVAIAPSFTLLSVVAKKIADAKLSVVVAAQNVCAEDRGAFTGEVSGAQLADVGCTAVIVGHSERRVLFGETNQLLNKKLQAAIRNHLIPIFCVGENAQERSAGKAEEVVARQIAEGFEGLLEVDKAHMVIAYEPVWAIGTGKNASPEEVEDMLKYIHTLVPQETRVLYGGSVTPDNATVLLQQRSVDGLLIGGASLDAEQFYAIITA